MYVPKRFEVADHDEIFKLISDNGFAIVVSHHDGRSVATHTPLVINQEMTLLHGHISRPNPQGKTFKDGEDVLCIFNGPHAYISSSWYDHENVPTWNYLAAHVYGKLRVLEGDELIQSLSVLVDKCERRSTVPVRVEHMSRDYLNQQIKGIVGFEVKITSIEAVKKLSQNRDAKNYQAIINALEQRDTDGDVAIANAMKERLKFNDNH